MILCRCSQCKIFAHRDEGGAQLQLIYSKIGEQMRGVRKGKDQAEGVGECRGLRE